MSPTERPDDRPVSVHARLVFDVTDPSTIDLLVVPADSAGQRRDERLVVTLDGDPLDPATIRTMPLEGTTLTVLDSPVGALSIEYWATVDRDGVPGPRTVADLTLERAVNLRPGRYTPSDELAGFAGSMFLTGDDHAVTALRIGDWVAAHLNYDPMASIPTGTAAHTLHAGAGVCRDFAHLTVALCRACEIPARVVAVYAPGLSPMDFHAVAEVLVDDAWWVIDATRLAPRQSLVRIATGRDASDTAFANVTGGATLTDMEVVAVLDSDELPLDDHKGFIAVR